MALSGDRCEIAFFDVETTYPSPPGRRSAILEFGAILVCPVKLVELGSYSTLVRPSDLSLISSLTVRCNGISRDAVLSSPTFRDVADRVYDVLHGRIWAGHNIEKFDCARIREAFADIGRPAPEPKGIIDSLTLLTQKFGRRTDNMKMATLATYFGLGRQTHRSLDDVRMNLEVLKNCATVLLLESSFPDIFTTNSWVSPNAMTSPEEQRPNVHTPPCENGPVLSSVSQMMVDNLPISSLMAHSGQEVPNLFQASTSRPDPLDMSPLSTEITVESHQVNVNMEEKPIQESPDVSSIPSAPRCNDSAMEFLDPDEVLIPSIKASLVQLYGSKRIKLLHKDNPLQLQCTRLQVRFGISTMYADHAGRPRLNFVVNASPSLCRVLDSCDGIAQKLYMDSGSSSEWKPVVSRKHSFNYPTVRLHIPTAYAMEIYQKENSGSVQTLVFSKFDTSELNTLFTPGAFVDAFFSLDPYDYQQNAGIRLVAKKLIIHSD